MAKTSAINKDIDSLADLESEQTLSNKTLTAPKFVDGGFIADANGNEIISLDTAASAVNNIEIANAASSEMPEINVIGNDTNIDLSLNAKGTGKVKIGTDEIATLAAEQSLSNKTITLAADPTNNLHAATKQYVDNLVNGLKWKQSVKCATSAAITIAESLVVDGTIDGITLEENDRVLVKDQGSVNKEQNGIYIITSTVPERAADANTSTELIAAAITVEQGTQANTAWTCTNNTEFTLDTDDVTFAQMAGGTTAHALTSSSHTVSGLTAGTFVRAVNDSSFAFSTLVLPNTISQYELLYASAANVISSIAPLANAILITNASGIPSLGTTLPAVTLTTPTIASFINAGHNHTANASGGQITDAALSSAISISKGGTGLTSFSQGDILYFVSGTTLTALAKSASVSRFLKNSGTNNAPAWGQIDLSVNTDTTGTLQETRGGTGRTTYATGDLLVADGTNSLGVVAKGNNNTFFGVNSSGTQGYYAVSGGITWNEVASTSQQALVANGYIANNSSLVTITLPVSASIGDTVRISGKGTGGWKLAQNAGQVIYFGNINTTAGASGYLASNHARDAVELICVSANSEWNVVSSIGNITVM